jgi:hypothetical protein
MRSRLRIFLDAVMLGLLASILMLQYTKQAVLPRSQTHVLWIAMSISIIAVVMLRSGWMRDTGWQGDQARFGAIVNDYYEPRREALSNGFAVGGGVLVALWWALATWSVVLGGIRRSVAGRGLADFEVAALVGAITGGLAGAVAGLIVGHLWETRHRRARLRRNTANA